jgi:microcystin-dependent protein
LICDGEWYEKDAYPELWEVIPADQRDEYGFVVPNLQQRFIRGGGQGITEWSMGGAPSVTLSESQLPSHAHWYTPPSPSVVTIGPGAPTPVATIGIPTTTTSAGSGQSVPIIPPYLGLYYIIKAR